MKSIIVIPTYNEKENILRLIEKIHSIVGDIHILVVDDNSPDGTGQIVKNLKEKDNRIHLIQREGKQGLGTAYCKGFEYCLENNFDYIFEMDADFSHDPNEIPNFLKAIESNDLILGSRYIKGVNVINWPLKRLLLSYFANMYTRFVTGMDVKDATGGFKCFRASLLKKIDLASVKTNGYGFQIEMKFKAWKKNFKLIEVPIIFTNRVAGESKISANIMGEAVFGILMLRIRSILGRL